ncbi:hypothetical protein AB0G02_28445 [Actinosynnema sp. NPDC023658]|uniref:hypothetical protein n=1 Tax=Actinosynnema sp. NPDC023658 TaxID=3155465 RepID=UPI0033E50B85
MSVLRATRTAIASPAGGALVATATASTASAAVDYSFTLCNFGGDFRTYVHFPSRGTFSPTAWTNQCVVTTRTGGRRSTS